MGYTNFHSSQQNQGDKNYSLWLRFRFYIEELDQQEILEGVQNTFLLLDFLLQIYTRKVILPVEEFVKVMAILIRMKYYDINL